jgi:hypothetical protein
MASILKVDTIQDQSGNNIINENADTITIGASGDTITVPSGATMTVPNGGLTGQNYPAFFATMSADQTGIPDSTFTKVQFNTERFDTDSAYDATTNYRFTVPAGQGGKYFFSSMVLITDVSASQTIGSIDYAFYINGAQNVYSSYIFINYNPKTYTPSVNAVLELSAGDYVEMYIYSDTTSGATFNINQDTTTKARCFWYGYRIGA